MSVTEPVVPAEAWEAATDPDLPPGVFVLCGVEVDFGCPCCGCTTDACQCDCCCDDRGR